MGLFLLKLFNSYINTTECAFCAILDDTGVKFSLSPFVLIGLLIDPQ
jgi:hypothetical protein